MFTRPQNGLRLAVALIVAATVVCGLLATERPAVAVQSTGTKTTASPNGTYNIATYTLTKFRARNETITRWAITFPVDTDVSGATGTGPGDVVTVSGQTVTVTLGTPIVGGGGGGTRFDISVRGIRNPTTAGAYNIPSVVFRSDGASQTVTLGGSGDYTIQTSPYLTLTITTPDATQSVLFGNIDPGVASSVATVGVEVDSSNPYVVTRTTGGAAAQLGLTITGVPVGVAQPAGFDAWVEDYRLQPPWTTDPGSYNATVLYTVVQQ